MHVLGLLPGGVSTLAPRPSSCSLARTRDPPPPAGRLRGRVGRGSKRGELRTKKTMTAFPIAVRPATDCRDVPEQGTTRAQMRFPSSVGPFPA